jgi:hypothetical protein
MNGPDATEPWSASVADVDTWLTAERAVIAAEIRDLEGRLREARVERERALKELGRLRGRGSVRVATAVDARATAARRLAARGARRVARATRPEAEPRADRDRRDGPEGAAGQLTPAAFREAFLSALDGRRLSVAVAGGAADRWERALRSAGWAVVDDPAVADVAIVAPDGTAPSAIERGPVHVRAGAVPDDERGNVDVAIENVPGDDARLVSTLVDALRAWVTATRIGIAIGPPTWEVASTWGDLYFARALRAPLVRRGHPTRIHILPEWSDATSARDDVAIHLFGLLPRRRLAGQRTILWVISHPDRVTDPMLDDADRVYVASDQVVDPFRARTRTPVGALHQATDPDVFRVDPTGPRHAVLFVGNTRGVRREIIDWITPTSLDLAIYGQGWASAVVNATAVRGDYVPNDQLHRWYGAAGVVLADHWPDMREAGFLSNRLYDVLASGGFAVSDAVAGIDDEFDGAVPTARSAGELRWAVRDALADPVMRRERARRGRSAVLERHTFAHRVDTILADLAADVERR